MTLRFLRVDLRCNGRHEQVQVHSHVTAVFGDDLCVPVKPQHVTPKPRVVGRALHILCPRKLHEDCAQHCGHHYIVSKRINKLQRLALYVPSLF